MSRSVRNMIKGVFLLFLSWSSMGMLSLEESAPTSEERVPRPELPCLDKRFSIVVHIVRDSLGEANVSEAQIESEVNGTNGLFDEICVSFEVCEFRYIDNFQWDTLDAVGGVDWNQMLDAHHQAYRINVFYVNHIIDPPGVSGFATLGGINGTQGGGICIVKPGGALTHEMGHFWGLAHPFAVGDELVDGSNCQTANDQICDTPADPYVPFEDPGLYVDEDCIFNAMMTDANGDFYDPDVGNIMSYYPCGCHFSYQQYWRMADTYTNNLQPNGQHMW